MSIHRMLQILMFCTVVDIASANDFIQIKASKVLGVLSFVESASGERSTSTTYTDLIMGTYKNDEVFIGILDDYRRLKKEYQVKYDGYPEARNPYVTTKDLIWQAASKADDLDQFNERIIGYLPHVDHAKFLKILSRAMPYFENMVWDHVQPQISRMLAKLSERKGDIEQLFVSASQFYGVEWDRNVPFVIALYPIPLQQGMTTAIPKGNTLICGFLTENENDYKGVMGIAVHEMCHILYGAQSKSWQTAIDSMFQTQLSPYARLAYSYIDEAMATAIGNGWSYKQLNGSIDPNPWYNDEYIDGFAKGIYDKIESYLTEGKTMDALFIDHAVGLFASRFPEALYNIDILMNSVVVFSDHTDEENINRVFEDIQRSFQIRSLQFSSPIDDENSKKYYHRPYDTKLFLIHKDHDDALHKIRSHFPDFDISQIENNYGYYAFVDTEVLVPVILIIAPSSDKFSSIYRTLIEDKELKINSFRRVED